VLEQLRIIRAETEKGFADIYAALAITNAKIGTLAENMVSMRKRIDDLDGHIQGLRTDVRMIAIAVDEHTSRLDRIEHKLSLHDA
jgi:chromosome segregation ATPase